MIPRMENVSKYPILLVEDNHDDILFIRRAFNKAQIINPLKVVEDGEEAMAYLLGQGRFGDRKEYPFPALILLDLKLPRISGYEVLS